MASVTTPVQVILGDLGMENYENELRVGISIINASTVALANFRLTDIGLGAAKAINPPAGPPLYLGTLGAHGTALAAARFSSAGLTAGAKYLLSVRAVYQLDGVNYGLQLNKYITLPAPALPEMPRLRARMVAQTVPNYWNYTLVNDEAPGSTQWLASFSVQVAAPVAVTGTPPGWSVVTDNISYVLWTADDFVPPYVHQVQPGQSLGGFQLMSASTSSESSPATVAAWDQTIDTGGRTIGDYLPTPARRP